MMRFLVPGILLLSCTLAAHAGSFTFLTDPFEGSTALTTPGRQIVGGEPFITFHTATDRFVFGSRAFGVGKLTFAKGLAEDLPETGVNVVVLETLDNDGNPATPFGAGTAANLIAARMTDSRPGFFIYFNSVLNLPRLVFSTNLGDNTADLKIVARMTNFLGDPAGMSRFTETNFSATPEPSSLLLVAAGISLAGWRLRKRGRN